MLKNISYISIIIILYIHKSTAGDVCPAEIQISQPQMSTTFMDGFWYEHFYYNTVFNNESCSHFKIRCNESTSSCTIQHLIWQAYFLNEIWNGTVLQKENSVEMTIHSMNSTIVYGVNIKFLENGLLIWACDAVNKTELAFATVLIRFESDNNIEEIWAPSPKNLDYLDILEGFPAGIWKIDDHSLCSSDSLVQKNMLTFSMFLMLCTICIQNCLM